VAAQGPGTRRRRDPEESDPAEGARVVAERLDRHGLADGYGSLNLTRIMARSRTSCETAGRRSTRGGRLCVAECVDESFSAFHRNREPRRDSFAAAGAALAALALALLFAEHESYIGLVQRALPLTFMVWVTCLGVWLITARPDATCSIPSPP
jgi:hypothetical protein